MAPPPQIWVPPLGLFHFLEDRAALMKKLNSEQWFRSSDHPHYTFADFLLRKPASSPQKMHFDMTTFFLLGKGLELSRQARILSFQDC